MMMIDDDDDDDVLKKTNTQAIRITQPDNRKHISPAHHKKNKHNGWVDNTTTSGQKKHTFTEQTKNTTPPHHAQKTPHHKQEFNIGPGGSISCISMFLYSLLSSRSDYVFIISGQSSESSQITHRTDGSE